MPTLETILAVALAGLALSATPGPSMLYVLSRSVGQSRAAGLASALGLGLGGALLAVATALGLAALFAQFDWMVPTLKIAGSLYLVWLGIGMIRDALAPKEISVEARGVEARPFLQIVRQGIVVEALNPKTVLFFALFLPPFVDQQLGGVETQLLILGILVPLTAIPSDMIVAWLGGTLAGSINRHPRTRQALAWAGGLVLIAIAANIHLGFI